MKLTFEEIKSITCGAVRFEETNGSLKLFRFTREQEIEYKKVRPEGMCLKMYSSSGMKLVFKTDSETMSLKVNVKASTSRSYFSIDVFSDEKCVGNIDNFSELKLKDNYTKDSYPLGEFEASFDLGKGIKTVTVYLPWSVVTEINAIELDDNSFVEAVKQKKVLLAFGDSITQGYDTLRPSKHYINRLAKMLNCDVYNKGIGGEIFYHTHSLHKDDFCPDYITVAYGTNDWSSIEEEIFKERCKAFYTNLIKNYPSSKIFALAPVWRKDYRDEKAFGDFEKVSKDIEAIVKDIKNVTYINCFDFIPHSEDYFGDLSLHPNDEGFGFYAERLYNNIFNTGEI